MAQDTCPLRTWEDLLWQPEPGGEAGAAAVPLSRPCPRGL